MTTTVDGVLASAGLSAFSEALLGIGANNVDTLAALPEATLLSPEIGMRKLHINKLLKALQSAGVAGATGPPPLPLPPEATAMAPVQPTTNVCSPEAQALLESVGLAAFAPKIADLCRRSAGGGPGPIGLDQLNALKDEDLLAEDSGGMKKVQLVKMRRALQEMSTAAPLSPQPSVASVETSTSAPLPPPQLPAVPPPPPAIIAASVAPPSSSKPAMAVATVSAAPGAAAETPVESAVSSPRVVSPPSPIVPEAPVSAALKGADALAYALAYQVAEREALMREAAVKKASDDEAERDRAAAQRAQASRDHAVAHANAHAAVVSSVTPAPTGGGGANQDAFKARALAAAEAERKMREAARAVAPPPSPWSMASAVSAATYMNAVDKKGEEWRAVVANAGLSAFEGGLVQAGVSSKETLQGVVDEVQSYGDSAVLIARVGLRKMQVKQLASSLANANGTSKTTPPTMMPAMAPVSISPASVAVTTPASLNATAPARVIAATATTAVNASPYQQQQQQQQKPSSVQANSQPQHQQRGFSPQRPSTQTRGGHTGGFEVRGGGEPSPEDLIAMGIDPGMAAREARGLWSEVRMGAPLSEVEAAVAEAVAEGEHSAGMGREIMRRVVQLEQDASQQRATRGAAPRSPLLRVSSSNEIANVDARKRAPSAPPASAPMATTVVASVPPSSSYVLPVHKEDVILSTTGSLGWTRSNLVVSSVVPYGQASSAGVKAGWEITAIDGVSCFDGFDVDHLMQVAGNRGQSTVLVSFLTKPPPPPAANAEYVAASRSSIGGGSSSSAGHQQQATPVNVSVFGGKSRGSATNGATRNSAETKSEVGNSEIGGGGRSCAVCTYVNHGTSFDCAMCGTALPPSASSSAPAGGPPRGGNPNLRTPPPQGGNGSSASAGNTGGRSGNGRPTVRAALTNASSLEIRNRRTNAMAGRGSKITEVEVYCPGESLGEVCLMVQLPGLSEPARIDVELPFGIETGQELIVPLPAHVADALERSIQGGGNTGGTPSSLLSPDAAGGHNNATPVSERVRSLRKAAAKATGMRGVFSGKGKSDQRDNDEWSTRSPNSGLSQDTIEGTFASPRSGSQYSAPYNGGGGMHASGNRRASAPGAMTNLSHEMANEQGNSSSGGGGGSGGMSGAERRVAGFFATAGLPTVFVPKLIDRYSLQSSSDPVGALCRLADDDALASVGMSKMQILRFNKAAPSAAGAPAPGGGGGASGSYQSQPSPQLQQTQSQAQFQQRASTGGVKVNGMFARLMQPPPATQQAQGRNGFPHGSRGGNNGAPGRPPNNSANHALESLSEEEQLALALRASMAPSGGPSSSAQNEAAEVAAAVARDEQQQRMHAGGPTNGRAMSPYQYIYETKPDEIAKATLQRLVALSPMLDKPTAIALLRAMAAISEEVDPRNEDFTVSNRIFNISYYFIWSLVQAGCPGTGSEGSNMVRELHTRIKPLAFTTQSFEEARPGIDAQVRGWRQNQRPTIGL